MYNIKLWVVYFTETCLFQARRTFLKTLGLTIVSQIITLGKLLSEGTFSIFEN